MSTPGEPEDPPFDPKGPRLGADGKLTGRVVRQAPELQVRVGDAQSARFEKLELVEREEKLPYVEPAPYRTEPKRSRRLPWAVALLFATLGVGTGLALWKWPKLQRELPLPPMGQRPTLFIQSEPSGATVRLGGSVVGVTPYAVDNLYSGQVPWSLSLAGHHTASGKIEGGQEQRVRVTLTPVR